MNANEANEVIQRLGGTNKTASLCDVSPQAVSQWRTNGLPKAQRRYLLAVRPDVFKPAKPQPEFQPQ